MTSSFLHDTPGSEPPEVAACTCWARQPHAAHRWERILTGETAQCPGVAADGSIPLVGDSPHIRARRETYR